MRILDILKKIWDFLKRLVQGILGGLSCKQDGTLCDPDDLILLLRPPLEIYLKHHPQDATTVIEALWVVKDLLALSEGSYREIRGRIYTEVFKFVLEKTNKEPLATEIASLISTLVMIILSRIDPNKIPGAEFRPALEELVEELIRITEEYSESA